MIVSLKKQKPTEQPWAFTFCFYESFFISPKDTMVIGSP